MIKEPDAEDFKPLKTQRFSRWESATYGKHVRLVCFRCFKQVGSTLLNEVYGCPECIAALDPEVHAKMKSKKATMIANSVILDKEPQKLAKRRAERTEELIDAEPSDEKKVALRAAQVDSEPALRQRDRDNALIAKIDLRRKFLREVDEAMAPFNALPRCRCCSIAWVAGTLPFVETADGDFFCKLCAYGSLRTGYCSPHRSVVYPALAEQVPRIRAFNYPREVLSPFTPEMFPEDDGF